MEERDEVEIRIALEEGRLSPEEEGALRAAARRAGRSPLALIHERGGLSEETLASIREELRQALEPAAPDEASPALTREPEQPATLGPSSPASASAPDPSIPAWGRYQCVRFLGQGGMGRVFLAYDPQLHRNVALKFVREDDPELGRRFLSEARAQARVDHERVCKVYEVGEIQGRAYIAMQYVDGRPLSALAGELTVEQKALILREVAEGVHEAHRAGLVHRDLKPSNILVERTETGPLKPYVMDFGLARDWNDGLTATGAVLGTPQYMAPEQARGEVSRLDRRADVYGLGATLYHLLTGAPPIPGSNGLEVLNNVATFEPRPPRALDPDLPADLEAIVLKCLEKDRSARYDSARAFAEDLERFLAGEPVRARSGPWYRLEKQLRKHRILVSISTTALVLVLLALGWAALARREVAQRERLARRFTESVERVEALARYSDLSRLHDTTAHRTAIRSKMTELEAEIRSNGQLAVGPGHYALGRGFLALGDEERAREHLETAWRHEFREPRVAYALALVIGSAYQQQLREVERVRAPDQREARRREVERTYRDPALVYLKQSQGAEVPSTEYVAALLAFFEDRFDEALARLDAIDDKLPWFYEAPKLRGDILAARATRAWNRGERERALGDFQAGREAYAKASAIGESVPAVHEALGELELAAMMMELYSQGDVMPCFDRGTQAVARALHTEPDRYTSMVLEARFYRRLGEFRMNRTGDVEAALQRAISDARRALDIAPARSEARMELGRSLWQWGQYRQTLNQDPRDPLREASGLYEAIPSENRDTDVSMQLGLVFKVWAEYEAQTGADPLPNQSKAIDAFREVTTGDPKNASAWLNLGIVYLARASRSENREIEADLDRARAALDTGRALNPQHIASYFFQAQVHELLAGRYEARGRDARPELDKALELYSKGAEINPAMPQFHNGAGQVLLREARLEWGAGGDPSPLIDRARAAFERAIAIAPKQGFGDNNVGETFALRAQYERALKKDPGNSARAAIAAYRRAIELIPGQAPPWSNLGKIYAFLASVELERGGDPSENLARAKEALGRALERNPRDAEGLRALGETLGSQASWRARRGSAEEKDFEAAAQVFERALEAAPERQETFLAFAQLCRDWASWLRDTGRDPQPPLMRGIALADKVLSDRPGWSKAVALRDSLRSLLER